MAFRADEAAREGLKEALEFLLPKHIEISAEERANSRETLLDLVEVLGPAVDAYPSWHPIVRNHNPRSPTRSPGSGCGYKGLDHTRYFANGFITCPYGDGQEVIDSVRDLPLKYGAVIHAEKLGVKFYHPEATPILVRCHWSKDLDSNGQIPLRLALPLLLEQELDCWSFAEVAETWETMRPYFLGSPHGNKSSLFVSQETGQAMKKVWETLINTGVFGPIKSQADPM